MSFDDGFILGLSLGGSGGGSGDEDTPAYLSDPDYQLYLDLPEPAANQIIMLLRVLVDGTTAMPVAPVLKDSYPDDDSVQVTVDYGNGSSRDFKFSDTDQSCTYRTAGNYIITVTKENPESLLSYITTSTGSPPSGSPYSRDGFVIALKCGSDMVFANTYNPETGTGGISNHTYIKYMKFNSGYIWNNGFNIYGGQALLKIDCDIAPEIIADEKFRDSNSLDFTNLMNDLFSGVTQIGSNAFVGCYCLRKAEFPNCVCVGEKAFDYCPALEDVKLPLCTSVSKCFQSSCYGLKTVEIPECISVSQCFTYNCYALSRVYAPKCTEVTGSFNSCFALNSVTLAEGCAIDSGSFQYCDCLIPSPNGKLG